MGHLQVQYTRMKSRIFFEHPPFWSIYVQVMKTIYFSCLGFINKKSLLFEFLWYL